MSIFLPGVTREHFCRSVRPGEIHPWIAQYAADAKMPMDRVRIQVSVPQNSRWKTPQKFQNQ
jgi:hypothetical protein